MKHSFNYILLILLVISLGSCSSSDDPQPSTPADVAGVPDKPGEAKVIGKVDVLKMGTFTSQSGSNTKGMIDLVTDESGDFFVKLSDDFNSSFHTGTVTVYLSDSKNLTLSETSSFQLVAVVDAPGEHYYKLPNFPSAKFTHGILWCGAAAIPFGYAEFN
ncbi:hypothetical protein [Algoriphagus chordae]|uniref:DM13 domain-containing protein n=1 Tax=Algoriphagus chordae TaxID=237019 RepID=A0A2W7QVD6_9BACT|nr:hypothetical protein [Algoriphagus chordae]PZX51941.1 hypothetical protein LV85_02090 [Algoriphagus chordae]